ncbi:Protein of unknown function [Arachidicoccus rhizosphaerae]|uniref:DUF4199 domain-containing protein n=1 Tax=Arachidicoccus rhizosphaerae TaxID=551991 RepID=A0A1H4BTV6_9BACT|nr:DUF4199 domain-containing protein [Arachidicoccus rhizosphaerae]SEA51524.1 Protein of unknown function [Arachidicoccus rhizosphaerae]
MENQKGKLWEKGIIIALIMIVYQLILHFTGLDKNKPLGWLNMLIFVGLIIYFTMQQSKALDGQVTFGNLFAYGFKIVAIVILIMITWSILMYKVIFPEMKEQFFQIQREAGLKKGATEDQINAGLAVTKQYFMVFIIAGTLLYYAVLGVIGALLGGAFSKRIPAGSSPFNQEPLS